MDVRGKGVVVTGASRGLGRALSEELGRAGARVLMVARGAGELAEAVEGVRRDGGIAFAHAADVASKQAVYAISGSAAELVGPVELVVHDASTLLGRDDGGENGTQLSAARPMPLLLDTACEELARVLEVNLVGPFRLTKALVGPMLLSGGGLVLVVSSDAAVNAYPRWGAYGASKAALDHLARTWAAELAESGVRFLSVDPGEMDTRMHAEAMPDADRSALADPRDVARRILALIRDEPASGNRVEVAALETAAPATVAP